MSAAVGVFGSAVSATMMAVAIGSLVSGVSDLVVDPITNALLDGKGPYFKLMHGVLAASVMTILAWGVASATTQDGWPQVWKFIAPSKAAAVVQANAEEAE